MVAKSTINKFSMPQCRPKHRYVFHYIEMIWFSIGKAESRTYATDLLV